MTQGGTRALFPDRAKLRVDDEVVAERIGQEIVLVHLGTEQMYTLGPVSRRIWDLLRDGLSLGELKVQLRDEFDVTGSQLEADLEGFLTEVMKLKLAELSDA